MDSASVKLINRKSLLKENVTIKDLLKSIRSSNKTLFEKITLLESQSENWKKLYETTLEQKTLFKSNYDNQKIISKNLRRKSFRNKMFFLGGGIVIGVGLVAILAN